MRLRDRHVVGIALALCAALVGCRGAGSPVGIALSTRTQFEAEWKGYRRLTSHKALAVAGDVGGRYVIGYGYAYPTDDLAIDEAHEDCEARRADRRIEAPCRLYAVGDTVVEDAGNSPTLLPTP